MSRRLVVEADGGSRGNPGPAGFGAVVRDAETGEVLAERAEGIGRATNNVAEYRGLIAGLRAAAELRPAAVDVLMDSKLVVEQMSGRWKVRHPDLAPLASEAAALARAFPTVRYAWVPRERNRHADRLANEAMDAAAGGRTWSRAAGPPRASRSADRRSTVDDEAGDAEADPRPTGAAAPVYAVGEAATAAPPAPGWSLPTGPPTSMLLLRHGETAYSTVRRFSGRGDLPLTERGAAQAEAAAERLATSGAAAVLASPLLRARRTAEAVAGRLGVGVTVDDGFLETDFGAWEGLTFAEVRERWPAELQQWLASPEVAPPQGESLAATAQRVQPAADRVLAAHPGATVVVVSHVTPIKLLLRTALAAPVGVVHRMHLDVCGLSIVDWYADGPAIVRLLNDTSHLSP